MTVITNPSSGFCDEATITMPRQTFFRNTRVSQRVIAIIPAHNEGKTIAVTIEALLNQSRVPDAIYVITDNCTDEYDRAVKLAASQETFRRALDERTSESLKAWREANLAYQQACDDGVTAEVAFGYPKVSVLSTVGNESMKAGALNRMLWLLLPTLSSDDVVMNFDADSMPGKHFVKNALKWLDRGYGAVGATFHGRKGGGFLGLLQRSEFARFARHQHRKTVCDVLSGTGSAFTVKVLQQVAQTRPLEAIGELKLQGVYSRHITEDFELTLCIKSLGYKTVAPSDCLVLTDVMEGWRDWRTQRERWQLGTLQALKEYGWSKHTREMIVRQYLIYAVMVATPLAAVYLTWSFVLFGWQGINPLHAPLYLVGIAIVIFEQAWQARKAGLKAIFATLVIWPDLLYSVARQTVYLKAAYLFLRKRATKWGAGTAQ